MGQSSKNLEDNGAESNVDCGGSIQEVSEINNISN